MEKTSFFMSILFYFFIFFTNYQYSRSDGENLHLQQKITTELVKRVSKRDITITRHHFETNHVRKAQSFRTTYGN